MFARAKAKAEIERLKAQLHDVQERSEVLDQAAGVGLWQAVLHNADAMDPRSVWTWSDEFRRLVGYATQAEFPNLVNSWADRLHPDDVAPTFAAFNGHLGDRTGRARYDVTYRLKTRDGSYRWFRATGGCRHSADGKTIRACGSLSDIHDEMTAKLQFDEERRQDGIAIGALAAGLTALAKGDTTHRIQVAFAPKAQGLKDDFNLAAERLQDALSSVERVSMAVESGSVEISRASDDLSRRTEQQAASLEETAAALDQITVTVRKTAQGAREAASASDSARSAAAKSHNVVREAVEAMAGIETSSRQINQIIGVIDEIAFQTNLLALNAGVEAARAGEAGKGFAVVASEVRALAQRSAEAAKEIKALLGSSTQQVEAGVALVGETGSALQQIVSHVEVINGLIVEIAASAEEQATGLQQVNLAVNQMDQVTQQNAAMVEQSTTASQALANEARELARLMGQFQTAQGGAHPPARTAPSRDLRPPMHRAPSSSPARAQQEALGRAFSGNAALKTRPVQDPAAWEEF